MTSSSAVWQRDIRCHQRQYKLFLLLFVEVVDGWRSSVTLILAACLNGRRGVSIVGDMFNTQLKSKLDALCADIAAHLDASEAASGTSSRPDEVSYRSEAGSPGWRPSGLGRPAAVGGQNDLRYAVFPETRRLVIDDRGNHVYLLTPGIIRFRGVPAQSSDRTLSFTSQGGLVKVAELTRV